MENKSKQSTKNFLILALLIVVLLVSAYFAYSRFIGSQELISVKINRVASERLSSKVLDLSVLNDPRFIKLKEIDFIVPNIKSINIGKDNPFSETEDNKQSTKD